MPSLHVNLKSVLSTWHKITSTTTELHQNQHKHTGPNHAELNMLQHWYKYMHIAIIPNPPKSSSMLCAEIIIHKVDVDNRESTYVL